MTEAEEKLWMEGNRAAWVQLLNEAIRNLGYDDDLVKASLALWVAERERVIAQLRIACRDYGDNDWPDNLNLADVIDKHLLRHLYENYEHEESSSE